jgi:hypothetical protein
MRTIAVLFCLTLPLAATGGTMDDPVLSMLPSAVKSACAEAFPGYRALRSVDRESGGAHVYRITFFSLADNGVYGRQEGDGIVTELPLYYLEVIANGTVVEESRHSVPESKLPKAVLDSYHRWNPKGVTGMMFGWSMQLQKGSERIYSVGITISAVKQYSASFSADGRVVSATPSPVK